MGGETFIGPRTDYLDVYEDAPGGPGTQTLGNVWKHGISYGLFGPEGDDSQDTVHQSPTHLRGPSEHTGPPIARAASTQPNPSPIQRAITSQAPPPPPSQRNPSDDSIGRPIERASTALEIARRGAYTGSPEWGGVGGGPRSGQQMRQDLVAHELVNAGYRQGVEQNALEDAVRGDPMVKSIEARRRNLAYEDFMPEGSSPHVRVGIGGRGYDYAGAETAKAGMPTLGEARTERSLIAQAAAKQNPKDVAEGALAMGRGRLAEELDIFRQQLKDEVRSGRRTPQDASTAWQKAVDQVQSLAEIMRAGQPKEDPFAGMGAGAPPAPVSGR